MIQPLSDKIISWLMYIFVAFWVLGWIFLLLIMLIQKIFPRLEEKSEKLLQTLGNIIGVISKYSFFTKAETIVRWGHKATDLNVLLPLF
jgi:hypothetical protein